MSLSNCLESRSLPKPSKFVWEAFGIYPEEYSELFLACLSPSPCSKRKENLEDLLLPMDRFTYRDDVLSFEGTTNWARELASDSTDSANMQLCHILARLEQLRRELKDANLGILYSNLFSRRIRELIFLQMQSGITMQCPLSFRSGPGCKITHAAK